jgi:hypothetical protein
MNTLKLEVGKSYINKLGEQKTIYDYDKAYYDGVYYENAGYCYDASGACLTIPDDNYDLVKEVPFFPVLPAEQNVKLHCLLPNNLFKSKEYQNVDIVGKVEYLLTMYQSQKTFLDQLN